MYSVLVSLDSNATHKGRLRAEEELTQGVRGKSVLGDLEVSEVLFQIPLGFEDSARPQLPHEAGIEERDDLVAVDPAEERGFRVPVAQIIDHIQVIVRLEIVDFVVLVLGLGPVLGADLPQTAEAGALVEALGEVDGADDVLFGRYLGLVLDARRTRTRPRLSLSGLAWMLFGSMWSGLTLGSKTTSSIYEGGGVLVRRLLLRFVPHHAIVEDHRLTDVVLTAEGEGVDIDVCVRSLMDLSSSSSSTTTLFFARLYSVSS